MVKSEDFGVRPEFKFLLELVTFRCLSFLICKMKVVICNLRVKVSRESMETIV